MRPCATFPRPRPALLRRTVSALAAIVLGASVLWAQEPERLNPSQVTSRPPARLRRFLPRLGLPRRTTAPPEGVLLLRQGRWWAAEDASAPPLWVSFEYEAPQGDPPEPVTLGPLLNECARWAAEKPVASADVVYGRLRDGRWYLAVCKKTLTSLGFKSIAFIVPQTGPLRGGIYRYSLSVNQLEKMIGFDLFPHLPSHLQEIIEEMTASEHLSVGEFDSGGPVSGPDREDEDAPEEFLIE